jgi:hypothetical protein
LFPEAELEVVDLPSPSLEGSCCARAPASGNANKLAASSIEREIETIATFLCSSWPPALTLAPSTKRSCPLISCRFRNAAHAEANEEGVEGRITWKQMRPYRAPPSHPIMATFGYALKCQPIGHGQAQWRRWATRWPGVRSGSCQGHATAPGQLLRAIPLRQGLTP